ncbi:peptide chain release factor H [Vibrio sp. S4M6]|uniref:peptide chain release factor H n=1 Tax=Vibrio sinus TaxID=2946865 RepID=UPI00202A4B74|nr:peptide chain release factor H [Vibrio sinus]MCL9780699.1 peptide chain release factor H [Vibrio sinus]
MILLQLSSGQGPLECCQAVGLALRVFEKECRSKGVEFEVVDSILAEHKGCFKSLTVHIKNENTLGRTLVQSWHGPMLWVCQSRFRSKHKRKNWFFSGSVYDIPESNINGEVTFQACKASGAGGQHVNTTDSAVRATHQGTGLSVKVASQRSQHANKRLAYALLMQKLEDNQSQQASQQDKLCWQQHKNLQRGNPIKTFKGEKFILCE